MRRSSQGYILPSTIILGLAVAMISVTFMQYTATSSQTLNDQSYSAIAQESAMSGITYADSCLELGTSWVTPISQQTTCDGTNTNTNYFAQSSPVGDWQSFFNVSKPDPATGRITSTGTVQILQGATVVKTYTATSVTTAPATSVSTPVATGNMITALKSNRSDCAIANGKLYCWGTNDHGQLGQGNTVALATPTLVGGALTGKTVTSVDVSDTSACAVADGTAYCWGENGDYQLGTGNTTNQYSPVAVTGGLSGKRVSEISTSMYTSPVFFLAGNRGSCGLANGVPYCWGQNNLGQEQWQKSCFIWCWPDASSVTTSTPVYGYNAGDSSSTLYQKKADRVSAGSIVSCMESQGKNYCWGLSPPLNWIYIFLPPSPVFPWDTGGDFSGKFIDPQTWEMSTNEACGMANTSFVCFGISPAIGNGWLLAQYQTPTTISNGVNITNHDNGDQGFLFSIAGGLYCAVDNGVPQCAGTNYIGVSGSDSSSPLLPLTDPGVGTGVNGKFATKIAAGWNHGCVVANGQLLCWGNGIDGRLADGNTGNHTVNYAAVTGGAVIGITAGAAASEPISVGGGQSCGVASGHLYCWGKNTNGQLGIGSTLDRLQPTAVPSPLNNGVNKVSAGANHTCAITDGQLYCWGLNTNGQLGIGSVTEQDTPAWVSFFNGKRVTDVSAGDTGTCAIANGQAYCWGLNSSSQLGNLPSTAQITSPALVNGHGQLLTTMNVTSISMGVDHACAVANGDGYCWGNNANGRTGLNTIAGTSAPTRISGGVAGVSANNITAMFTQISAGNGFTCAIINGAVSCWGSNANGRTGLGTTAATNQLVPAYLSGPSGTYFATSVSAGDSHACAVINGNNSGTNGNIRCWGAGTDGRLGCGVGCTSDSGTAVVINGGDATGKSAINISAGSSSTCSVSNGDILCWGEGSNGRLGSGGSSPDFTPTVTSGYSSLVPFTKGPVY